MSIFRIGFAGEKRWQSGWVIVKADSEEEAKIKATKHLKRTRSYRFTFDRIEELKPDENDVLAVC